VVDAPPRVDSPRAVATGGGSEANATAAAAAQLAALRITPRDHSGNISGGSGTNSPNFGAGPAHAVFEPRGAAYPPQAEPSAFQVAQV